MKGCRVFLGSLCLYRAQRVERLRAPPTRLQSEQKGLGLPPTRLQSEQRGLGLPRTRLQSEQRDLGLPPTYL